MRWPGLHAGVTEVNMRPVSTIEISILERREAKDESYIEK